MAERFVETERGEKAGISSVATCQPVQTVEDKRFDDKCLLAWLEEATEWMLEVDEAKTFLKHELWKLGCTVSKRIDKHFQWQISGK